MDSMEAIVLPHHFHTLVDLTPMIGESANPPPVAKTNVENSLSTTSIQRTSIIASTPLMIQPQRNQAFLAFDLK